jgi:hypothetical protein
MLRIWVGLFFATAAYPLWYAWQANRRTSLVHAVYWLIAAWTAWGLLALGANPAEPLQPARLRHLALGLTGCAGVAVLGARRPGVGAWNFVVFGLLAVLLLPQAEGLLTGTALHLDTFHTVFLAATLAVGVLNYLSTRFAVVALFTAALAAVEILQLHGREMFTGRPDLGLVMTGALVAVLPWLALEAGRTRVPPAEFDRLWLGFRNRYGLVWGQRLREQFNNAAGHAGWPVVLRWQGLRLLPGTTLPDAETQAAIVAALRALMKRFGPERDEPAA